MAQHDLTLPPLRFPDPGLGDLRVVDQFEF